MKKLVLAVTTAVMMLPALAYGSSIQDIRTTQVMQCVDKKSGSELEECVADVIQWTLNNGAHEATKEITSHIEDVTGIKTINGGYQVHAAIAQIDQALAKSSPGLQQQLDEARAELALTRQNTEYMFGILQVITEHKAQAGKNFANDPVGYIEFAFQYIEDRQADLRRAEDRIRELERELRHHRSGGYWNPTNW